MNKETIIGFMNDYLLAHSSLDETEIAKKINIDPKKVKTFLLNMPESWGFFREDNKVYVAHSLLRENIECILDEFWQWYVETMPSYTEIAWQEGGNLPDLSSIKVQPCEEKPSRITKSFSGRIVILGDEKVGKQSFVYALSGDTPNRPAPGVLFGSINRKVKNFYAELESIILEVPESSSLWLYAKSAFGIILIYDVTDIDTFNSIENWLEAFLEHYSYVICPPIMILGNKIDLIENQDIEDQKALLSTIEAEWSKKYGTICLSELISCLNGRNVLRAFNAFVNSVKEWITVIKTELEDLPE